MKCLNNHKESIPRETRTQTKLKNPLIDFTYPQP